MRTAMPIFHEDAARDVTLAAHTQAVERAVQAMHTHLHEVLKPGSLQTPSVERGVDRNLVPT